MVAPTDPTKEGADLIERWKNAQKNVTRAEGELSRERCALSNAVNALGKWMLPNDAKDGERYCIWYGDSLIQVSREKTDGHDYKINARTRGRSLT